MRKNNQQGFIVILIPIIIIVVLIIIFSGSGNKTDDNNNVKSGNTVQVISESDAEEYCQDNALLSKYLDMDKVSVIDVANYNKQFTESGDKDSDGNKIMMLTWNGKVNDKTTGFTCMVSGKKGDIRLQLLSVGGQDLYNKMNI